MDDRADNIHLGPWIETPYRVFFHAIESNRYVHPRGIAALKQWGFVLNTVFQIEKLLTAPAEIVHGKTFYLSDYESIDLGEFADKVQAAFGSRPVRRVSPRILAFLAKVGDLLARCAWRTVPIVVDDTCDFIPCDTKQEAEFLADLLNFETAQRFISALVFIDAKRPVTADILRRIDLKRLAKHEGQEGAAIEYLSSRSRKSGRQRLLFVN